MTAAMVESRDSNRWWLVAAAGLVVFMAVLDMTAVNVALPTIERELGTRTSVTQWVVLGYLLPLIALTLPAGRWLDGVGKRAALLFSVAGFAASSVAVGLAVDIGWLIGARIVQGAFGAILLALAAVLATIAVHPQARGRALGVVTTVGTTRRDPGSGTRRLPGRIDRVAVDLLPERTDQHRGNHSWPSANARRR
jgi:MFS family permease